MRQQIPWKQPPAKTWHLVFLCPKVLKASSSFVLEAQMRQPETRYLEPCCTKEM